MDKDEFIDRLNRAYEMEEGMAGELIDLCQPDALPAHIPPEVRERLRAMFLSIQADTLRHKAVVAEIMSSLG